MLFVAPEFLLIFLPIVLVGYWALEALKSGSWSMGWLLLASIVFYSFSGGWELALFICSLCVNFTMGKWLAHTEKRWALPLCVGLNLSLLALFKYADFGIGVVNSVSGSELPLLHLRLPLAISFYTFQQIAYLVKCRREHRADIPWQDYALAVAFFPHLIAGPLVHYHALVSQFHSDDRKRVALARLHEAIGMFVIALGKKLLIADSFSPVVGEIFGNAHAGAAVSPQDAWIGALAYTFQIYFDFSAYSEMAIALGLMFGLVLPVNFMRPYLAVDLRDFWRRWHMTLSEFLRDYLYIPLGGNRRGRARRWLNLFLTMLLGGLWHGAGWNFMAWGGLHGLLLAVNHAWASRSQWRFPTPIARLMTFTVVIFLWVPFRAESWQASTRMWTAMCGMASEASQMATVAETEAAPPSQFESTLGAIAGARGENWDGLIWQLLSHENARLYLHVLLGFFLVFACRSNLELSADAHAKSPWRALALGLLLFAIVARNFHAPAGEFLYFRF